MGSCLSSPSAPVACSSSSPVAEKQQQQQQNNAASSPQQWQQQAAQKQQNADDTSMPQISGRAGSPSSYGKAHSGDGGGAYLPQAAIAAGGDEAPAARPRIDDDAAGAGSLIERVRCVHVCVCAHIMYRGSGFRGVVCPARGLAGDRRRSKPAARARTAANNLPRVV